MLRSFLIVLFVSLMCSATPVSAQAKPQHPNRFGIIFNMGYSSDRLPQDAAEFERTIVAVKSAHFNVVLCQYSAARAEICKKHDMQIMVDLLVPDHHVYRNVEGAKKLCESLRDNNVVYAYHIWSDNIGETYPGRTRDVANVKTWDPTHPVYVGCAKMSRIQRVQKMDLMGYYDFQWKRGGHWSNLSKCSAVAKAKGIGFLRYCDSAPGRVGVGNVNRAGFTVATSIPFGLKGYLYHYGGGVVGKDGQLDILGEDLKQVNSRVAPFGSELLKLGNPAGLFSTTVTKTAKDRPVEGDAAVPGGLTPIPADHWYKVSRGEVLIGEFGAAGETRSLVLTSHNAYQPQAITIRLAGASKGVSRFDADTKKWQPLKVTNGTVETKVAPFAIELVKFE